LFEIISKIDNSFKSYKKNINENNIVESNINRIKQWIDSKDIAGISAFRNYLNNATDNTLMDKSEGEAYSKPENIRRNRELKASLLKLGYGVTAVRGSYVEGAGTDKPIESQEQSFIVVNLNDDPAFKNNIAKLSEYYNRDSYLYKPKDSEEAYLIGSNNNDFPGYGNENSVGSFKNNVSAEFMSRLGSKGFAFSDNENNPLYPEQRRTFDVRKQERSDKYDSKPNKDADIGVDQELGMVAESDIINMLNIVEFKREQINSKRLITEISKGVLKKLKLINE
jgi:hypothetical protein